MGDPFTVSNDLDGEQPPGIRMRDMVDSQDYFRATIVKVEPSKKNRMNDSEMLEFE